MFKERIKVWCLKMLNWGIRKISYQKPLRRPYYQDKYNMMLRDWLIYHQKLCCWSGLKRSTKTERDRKFSGSYGSRICPFGFTRQPLSGNPGILWSNFAAPQHPVIPDSNHLYLCVSDNHQFFPNKESNKAYNLLLLL